ncbi:MAG: hypothetical protein WD510_02355, partial [Balneolaceae bacterium]
MRFFLILLASYGFFGFPNAQAASIQDSEIGYRIGISGSAESLAEMEQEILVPLQEMGVSVLEIRGFATEALVEKLQETDLFLFVMQNRRFTTPVLLDQNGESFREQDRMLIQFYESRLGERVRAYGLFQYPSELSPGMLDGMNRHAGQLHAAEERDLSFYYQSSLLNPPVPPSQFSFLSSRFTPSSESLHTSVVHFHPDETAVHSLTALRDLLGKTLEREQSIVIIDLEWLLEQLDRFDLLAKALQAYSTDQEILFPLPSSSQPHPSPNRMVILLIAVLATYLVHYSYYPIYQRSLFRYFTAHKFFVEDVMDHRLRNPISGVILFLQHVILCGLFAWVSIQIFFSPLGIEALFFHFPFLSRFGTDPFGFFLWGVLFASVLQTVSIIWLHLPNKKTRSFGQTLNLYVWPLHLNLLTMLILVTLYQAGNTGGGGVHTVFFLFLFVWFSSFNIAAFDSVR